MFFGASLILSCTLALFGYALLRRGRKPLAKPYAFIAVAGLFIPAAILCSLLVYGVVESRQVSGVDAAVDRVIHVIGHRWYWEFGYEDSDGCLRSRNHLVIPKGEMIELHITSSDVIHSFWIPRLGGKMDAIPDRTNTLRLRADDAGPIRGQCAEFCGLRHAEMIFDVSVLARDEFQSWLTEGNTALERTEACR